MTLGDPLREAMWDQPSDLLIRLSNDKISGTLEPTLWAKLCIIPKSAMPTFFLEASGSERQTCDMVVFANSNENC